MFAFTMSDGSIQFRYRDTMEVVIADDKHDEVHTMPQSGFAFSHIDTCKSSSLLPRLVILMLTYLRSSYHILTKRMCCCYAQVRRLC
jgi:mediator of RNA polymerase II transcription subunit 16